MLTLIKGRSGRGKTHHILTTITELVQSQSNTPIFLVVPDQMSFQTEYQLLNMLEHNTMLQVEIVGLSRFISRLIEELQPIAYTPFETMAQKMLLQHAAITVEDSLQLFKEHVERAGFIDYLQQFYRQMRGSDEHIDQILEKLTDSKHHNLRQKMLELAEIYATYEASLTSESLDTSNRMELLQQLLENPLLQEKLQRMHVFIDGYHMFNTQEFETIASILEHVQNGMVTFTLGEKKAMSNSIFATVQRQFDLFVQRFPSATVLQLHTRARFTNPILGELEENYETPSVLQTKDMALTVDIYPDKTTEVSLVASQIRKLLMDGVKAKEIAVYVASKEQYQDLLTQIFTRYELPFYIDLKDAMLYHPLMQWLRLQSKIYIDDWIFEDVMALSQNEYFRYKHQISDEMYYIFLQQIDRIKLPYKSIWSNAKYWSFYERPGSMEDTLHVEKTEIIQQIRTALLSEIAQFSDSVSAAESNRTLLASIFTLLSIDEMPAFFENLQNEKPTYASHLTEQQYHEMVWTTIVQVLEQIHAATGHLQIQKQSVIHALMLGIDEAEFTSVPLGFDAIMIGDYERSRFQTIHQDNGTQQMGMRHTFILGLVEGTMPHMEEQHVILTDRDMLTLQQLDAFEDVLLDKKAILYQLFRFYALVTSTAESLHLSYYKMDGMQAKQEYTPAQVISNFLQDGFNLPIRDFTKQEVLAQYKYTLPEKAFHHQFSLDFFEHVQQESEELRYIETTEAAKIIALYEQMDYKNSVDIAGGVTVPEHFSVSQLETYNLCPYKYFLQYILQIQEPFKNVLAPLQSGTVIHGALDGILQSTLSEKIHVRPLVEYLEAIDAYFVLTKTSLSKHPLLQTMTNNLLFDNMQDTLVRSFQFMYEADTHSRFIPIELERKIASTLDVQGKSVHIRGVVDRIDQDETGEYFRIVDYKSSKRALDFDKLLTGTQLQLPFYSYILSEKLQMKLAGSIYTPIVDPILSMTGKDDPAIKLLKEYQATGFFLQEQTVLESFDTQLLGNQGSNIITYKAKKDGTPDSHSTTMTVEEIAVMHEFTVAKTKATITNIQAASFDVKPERVDYDHKKIACKFCAFRSICQFDQKVNAFDERSSVATANNFQKRKQIFIQKVEEKGGMKNE